MGQFVRPWLGLRFNRRAVTSLEHGIITAIVPGVALVGFTGVGTSVPTRMNKVKNAMG